MGIKQDTDIVKCYYCGAETELYLNGNPICLHCLDESERRKPVEKDGVRGVRDTPPYNEIRRSG